MATEMSQESISSFKKDGTPTLEMEDSVIPAEFLKMDAISLQMYKEALNEGMEKVYNIRVMVVGQYGVGKTTLIQRLLGKNVNISERHSTEGIDVHVECSKVSLTDGEWTTQEKNAEKYSRLQRLVQFLNYHVQKRESKSKQEGQSELDDQVTIEESCNRHHQHDPHVSDERDLNQEVNKEVKSPTSQVDSPIARVIPEASSGIKSKEKDTVMEILQLINENSGNLEKSTMKYATLALWDFAGQYAFYTTHQTFLTSRAIYLLVIDLSQQITDIIKDDEYFLDTDGIKLHKVHDMIEIWMNSIHSCTPSSQPGIPYVILVGTHVDKIPENCRQRVIDEYFIHICEILSNKPAALHRMDCIAIDNTQSDPRLGQLKRRIFELAKQQRHWGEEKPARWLILEQAILTLKASGVKVVSLSLIEEINRAGSVRIENRDELDLFLRFQHEMGTILYFSIEGLREKIVLEPQWLIDALKSLITAETFIRRNPAIIRKWIEFKESGKLTHELIDAVWSKDRNPEFHDNKDHIILLMEKLNIIARPRTYDQDGKEVKVENFFLAPCMLYDTTPIEIIFPKPNPERENSSVLCYVFIEQFLPTPIFHRLLATCIAHWPIAKRTNLEYLIFCGCAVFQLDFHHKLTVFFKEHVIFVRVTRMGINGETPSTRLCIEVKEFISITLSNIIGNLEQSLRFKLCIKCPKSEEYGVNSMIPVADLQGNIEVPCHFHDDSHVILSSDVLKFWFEKEKPLDDAFSSLPLNMQDKKPSERQLGRLSVKFGQVSIPLSLELGLSWADIGQIQRDYSHTVTQCLMIFIKWQQQNNDKATFKNLEKAFQQVGIDVDILKSIDTGETREYEEDIVSCLPSDLQDKEPSEVQLGRLSIKIGQKFLLLGLELGLTWMDIKQVLSKYSHTATQCLLVLIKWKQQCEDRVTFRNLEKAFQLVDINVDILKTIGTTGDPTQDQGIVSTIPLHLREKQLSEGQLEELSKKIGQEFLLLALELGLAWEDIQRIQQDVSHTLTEFRRMLLIKWQQQNDEKATFENLEKAFQIVGIDVKVLKSIVTGIPLEILNMDKSSIQLFEESLKTGKERVYNIRVMTVGQFGVGKTTLVKRLLGKTVNISDRISTDGIDVHMHCCDISLTTKEWIQKREDSDIYYRLNRLVKLVNEHVQKQEPRGEQEEQSVMNDQHDDGHRAETSRHQVIRQTVQSKTEIKKSNPFPPIQHIQPSSVKVDERPVDESSQKKINVKISVPETISDKSTKREEAVMEMLQLINENSDKIEKNIVEHAALAMWDFAGQYIFYTTHQTFLTSRAIYLLVIDLSQKITDLIKDDDECFLDTEGTKECKVHDVIEIWMNSIHSCAPLSNPDIPPVILVGTHLDKIPKAQQQEIINKYFERICCILNDKPTQQHLVEFIAIDNTQLDSQLKTLQNRIFELASEQSYWGEEVPASWLPLEAALMKLRDSGIKVIQLNLFEELNQRQSVPVKTAELDLFLRFQHEIGNILYFSMEGLRERIVLNPQWLIDALKTLITADMFILKNNPSVRVKWIDFKDKGKLTHDLIDALWTKKKTPDFHDNKKHLLLLMEQLNIIAKPKSYPEDGKQEEEYYLAPCMLRQAMPKEIICLEPHPEMECTSVLCFMCTGKFLPPPIFHRLVGACLIHWPIAKQKSENLIYCGCCVFDLDDYHRLTIYFRDYIIFARVIRMGVNDTTLTSELCIKARNFIFENLSKIVRNLGQSLQFEIHIKCPDSDADSSEGLNAVSLLQKTEQVVCRSHDRSHILVSKDLLQYWFKEELNINSKPGDTVSAISIANSSISDRKESHRFAAEDTTRLLSEPIAAPRNKFEQKMSSVEEIQSNISDLTMHEDCQMSMQRKALPTGMRYHVFFIYCHSDIEWVRKTVGRLEKDHGFVCCEYDRDNTPGTPLLKFAANSIRTAYKTVVVMTREAFQSKFVEHEIEMAMNQQLQERRNCVIPVLLEVCEIPIELRVLNYVDARDTIKLDIWWPKLVMELESQEQMSLQQQQEMDRR